MLYYRLERLHIPIMCNMLTNKFILFLSYNSFSKFIKNIVDFNYFYNIIELNFLFRYFYESIGLRVEFKN